MTTSPKHPAKFSEPIISWIQEFIGRHDRPMKILDPMAGVGTIHRLRFPGIVETFGLEIETEWADQHPMTLEGDATDMPFNDDYFDAVIFSPPYGNRMADQFISKDGTKRITYMHFLGLRLHENSAAGAHWGPPYWTKMHKILVECKRVVKSDGMIIINVSDFIRSGEQVPVVEWYINEMFELGFFVDHDEQIPTKRMRFGANHKLRVDCEHVLVFKRRRF